MMRKRLALIVFLILVIALPLIVLNAQRQQELRQRASELPTEQTATSVSFELVPTTSQPVLGQSFTVDVYANTGANNVSGVDFTVTFPTNTLSLSEFKPSDTFGNILAKTVEEGKLRHAAGILGTTGVNGRVKVGTLIFEPKATGDAGVSFENVQITGIGKLESLAYEDKGVTAYTVAETATPTPTPTSTIGLTISPISVTASIAPGGRIKAFDLTSTGAAQYALYNTQYGIGIGLEPSFGSINKGQTIPIYLYAQSRVPGGKYYLTGSLTAGGGIPTPDQINFPIEVTVLGPTPIPTGAFGKALQLYGGSCAEAEEPSSSLDFSSTGGPTSFTIAGWFKVSENAASYNINNIMYIIAREARFGYAPSFTLGIRNNKLEFIVTSSAGFPRMHQAKITGNTELTKGVWYHFAVGRDFDRLKLILNGKEDAPYASFTPGGSALSGSLAIGCQRVRPTPEILNFVNYFQGELDEIGIYNVAPHVQDFSPPPTKPFPHQGTVGYALWQFDGDLTSRGGIENNLRAQGTVSFVDSTVPNPGYTPSPPPSPTATLTPTPSPTPTPTPIACRTPINSCRADVNRDGPVTVDDWTILARCQNQAPSGACAFGDYNKNGTIDSEDLACLQEQYNTLCADINIPTPDGVVNILDFSTFADAFRKWIAGEYVKKADFNDDGKVDLIDFEMLRAVFNKTLVAPATR